VNYLEHEAKTLLAARGLTVPVGRLVAAHEQAQPVGDGPWFVKAQVPLGGRGKSGLVRRAGTPAELAVVDAEVAAAAPGAPRLVERAVPGLAERYVGLGLDGGRGTPYAVAGLDGGIEVEASDPRRRARTDISPSRGVLRHDGVVLGRRAGFGSTEAAALGPLLASLWEIFRDTQGDLLEINPLIWDGSTFVLTDAKLRTFEREAEGGTVYFHRPGSVAVLSGGAGLGMALADMLHHLGTPPANFCDVVGGVTRERLLTVGRQVVERTHADDVRAVLIVLSLSLTRLDGVLEALCEVFTEHPLSVPAVAYFGSGAAQSDVDALLERIRALGVDVVADLQTAVTRVAALAGGRL
jgi:succinyl-CoA synthetase beta subunit